MDRTLNPVKRGNKRRRARNWKAWQLFSPDGDTCRFCPHGAADHLTSSGAAPLLPARRRGGLAEFQREALPPRTGRRRRGAGQAHHRRQARRAADGLLHRLRGGKGHSSGVVLPADAGQGRGGGFEEPQRQQWHQREVAQWLTTRPCTSPAPAAGRGSPRWRKPDEDIHAGETDHCNECGAAVVFVALSMEMLADPAIIRWNCHFCKPGPCRLAPSSDATGDSPDADTGQPADSK